MIKIKTDTLEKGKTNRKKRVQRRHKKQIKTDTLVCLLKNTIKIQN